MTNQKILTKAIEKAITGGWKQNSFDVCDGVGCPAHDEQTVWSLGGEPDQFSLDYPSSYIFNHDFAKALWGSELSEDFVMFSDGEDYGEAWQFHLQQMVIADDPITYLGEHI